MNEVWTILALCIVVVLGAALPLLKDRFGSRIPARPPADDDPSDPRQRGH